MKIEIKSRCEGKVLFELETDSLRLCLEAAVKSKANLSGANLYGANLDGKLRLPTGETWDQYLTETVPALLVAGGRRFEDVATAEVWGWHAWDNCPMAIAFGVHSLEDIPIMYRPRADQFIQFFDAKLIPLSAVGRKLCSPPSANTIRDRDGKIARSVRIKSYRNHVLLKADGAVCLVCGCVEPVHPGNGTPAGTLLYAYRQLLERHPRRKHPDPFKLLKRKS